MSATVVRWATFLPGASVLGCWFTYLLIAPTWGFFWIDAWHNEQRAVQTILLVATALLAVSVAQFRTALAPQSRAALLLWVVAVLGATSALTASFIGAAFAEISLCLLLVTLVVVTAASVRQDPIRLSAWIRRVCVVLAIVHVTGIGARYAAMLALDQALGIEVLLLGYANPRFPSALYALLMPFVAMFVLDRAERRAFRRVAWVALALLWCINIALGTRAIWFAYVLAVPLILTIVGWRSARPGAVVLASTALAGFLAYLLLFVGVPTWFGLGTELPSHIDHLVSVSDRAHLWRQTWELITSHPLFGVGPMNLAALGDSYASHPHNWVLQLAAEWGIPALGIVLWILLRVALEIRAYHRSEGHHCRDLLAPLAATVIGLCYGFVDGNLIMPVSQTAFALVAGVLLGNVSTRGAPKRGSFAWLGSAAVVASAAFLIAYVVETLPEQADNESTWRRTSQHSNLAPRFWQQGLLR